MDFAPPPQRLKLRAYVFKYPKEFWQQAAGGIVYNTAVVAGPVFLGRAIDAANLFYRGEGPLEGFYRNLAAFLGFTLLFQMARYFKRYYMRTIVNLMKCDIRAGLLASLFGTPLRELNGERTGDMMSRMIGDVEQVGASVQTTVTELWDTALLMASYFTVCLIYSPRITLLAAIPVPLAVFTAQMLRKPLYDLSRRARKSAAEINVYLQHTISGIALLRLFGLEESGERRFSKLLDEQLKWNVASAALQNGMLPLYILTATGGIVVVAGMGGEYVVSGRWTIGMFTAFLSMFTAMAVRTNVAAKVMNTWHGAKASWDRICEKLNKPQGFITEPGTDEAGKPSRGSFLEVRALSFAYPFAKGPCLEGLSFRAERGEILGITGPVGSGKSALAAALSGLYPYGGTVQVKGRPLRELGADRSRIIAYMDSQQFVFSADAAFNISLDREGGDLEGALVLAELEQDLAAFEQGLHTPLMERGLRISGGQRQRIALARALYGGAELLLLDDPFSAIDINMERTIMAGLRRVAEGRVILLFSHRLAAFPLTDRVLVIDHGRLLQEGPHGELVRQEGLYRDIFSAQEFMRNQGEGR